MTRWMLPVGGLALGTACVSSVDEPVGCEVELSSRPRIEGSEAVVEVWVTSFHETRTLEIPDCVGILVDSRPIVPCGPDGEPDPSGCQPGAFQLRGDTSLQVAQIAFPLEGDACNEPVESGAWPVGILGIDTGDHEVCNRLGILVVP